MRRALAILLAIAIAVPAGFTMGTDNASDAPIVSAPGPSIIYIDGDWEISTLQDYWNKTLILKGNLAIKAGGALELHNSSLRMDCAEDLEFRVDVYSGGALRMYDFDGDPSTTNDTPTITSHEGEFRYSITAWLGSEVDLHNFAISYCGASSSSTGLKIQTNDAELRNGTFSDCYAGLYLSGTTAVVSGCTFERVRYGIYSFQSWAKIDNCTIDAPLYYGLWALYGKPIIADTSISTGWSGVYLNRADATLIRTSVTGFSGPAVQCWDSSPLIIDSTLSGGSDLQARGASYPGLINGTFEPSKITAGSGALVSVGSYLPLRVTDALGAGFEGAAITVLDSSGLASWSGTSGPEGNATAVECRSMINANGIQNRSGSVAYAYIDKGNWTEAGSATAAPGCTVQIGNSSALVYLPGNWNASSLQNATGPLDNRTIILDGKVLVAADQLLELRDATVIFDASSVTGASLDISGRLLAERARLLSAAASRPLLAVPYQILAAPGSALSFLDSKAVRPLEFRVQTDNFSAAGSTFEYASSYAMRFENSRISLQGATVVDSAGGLSFVRCQVEASNLTVDNVVGNALYSYESRGNVTDFVAELAQYGAYLHGSILNITDSTFGGCYVGAMANGAGATLLRGSDITGSSYAGFQVYSGHAMRLEECDLAGNYIGLDSYGSDAWVESSSISSNQYGLFARSTSPVVSNSSMSNAVDIATERGARPALLNTSFSAGALQVEDSSYVSVGGFAMHNVTVAGAPAVNATLSIDGGFSSGSTSEDGLTGWLPFRSVRYTSEGAESSLPAEVVCLYQDVNGSRFVTSQLNLSQGAEYALDMAGGSECLVWEDDVEIWEREKYSGETLIIKGDVLVLDGGSLELDGCDVRLWKRPQMSHGIFSMYGSVSLAGTSVAPFVSAKAGTPLAGAITSNLGTNISITHSHLQWTPVRAFGGLTLEDVELEDSAAPGIYANGANISASNVSVSFCQYGIQAYDSIAIIDNLKLSHSRYSGLEISGGGAEAAGITASRNEYGAYFVNGAAGNLTRAKLSQNQNGAYIGNSAVSVRESRFDDNPGFGIQLDQHSSTLENITCSHNGGGVALFDSTTLIGNLSSSSNGYGLYSYGSAPHLRDCSFDGDTYGIYSVGRYSATLSTFDSGLDDAMESFIDGGSRAKNSLSLPARARIVSAGANVTGVDLKKAAVNADRATQMSPALWNDTLIYSESNGQAWNIIVYDLTKDSDGDGIFNYMEYPHIPDDPARTRITDDELLNFDADIWCSTVVWSRYSDETGFDIMAHDLVLNKTWVVCGGASASQHSTVWGDTAAWSTVEAKYEIYTGPVDGSSMEKLTDNGMHNWFPDLWEDRLVWSNYLGSPGGPEEADVFLLNLTTRELTLLTDYPSQQSLPSIWDNLVAYQDNRQGDTNGDGYSEWGIRLYNLTTGEDVPVTVDAEASFAPRVQGDKLVWYWHNRTIDDATTDVVGWSVYMYNITTGVTDVLERETYSDSWPVPFGPRVAWSNRTGGYGDIWVYDQRYAGVPANPWLDVGDDGSAEWSEAGTYSTTKRVNSTVFAASLASRLGDTESDGNVSIPLRLGSESTGRLRLSELEVVYELDGLGERIAFNGSGAAGVYCADSGFRLVNSSFSESGTEAILDDAADLEILNCSFGGGFVFADAESNVTVRNFLHVRAENEGAAPIEGARVRVWDGAELAIDGATSSWGQLNWSRVTDRMHNSTGVWENATTVQVDWGGAEFGSNPRNVSMNASHLEVFSTDAMAPRDSNHWPKPGWPCADLTPEISVHVTDLSGVVPSSIRLYVQGYAVYYNLSAITNGYNVSYWHEAGFAVGTVVQCRIVALDSMGNRLDRTWSFTVVTSYDIPLLAGWNLVSLPLAQVNESILAVLASIDGKWDYAMAYDSSDPADPWKTHYADRLAALNDLSELDHTMGFWLNVTENCTFRVYGLPAGPTAISLRAGWNLVGYPTLASNVTAGAAFSGTGADIVEAFDPGAEYRVAVVAPTYVLSAGSGYWVHVSSDAVWYVDW